MLSKVDCGKVLNMLVVMYNYSGEVILKGWKKAVAFKELLMVLHYFHLKTHIKWYIKINDIVLYLLLLLWTCDIWV